MKIYKDINKILALSLILFAVFSLSDLTTTYIGLNNGFAEQSHLVSFFWYNYNIFGLIITKFISILTIVIVAVIFKLISNVCELNIQQNVERITLVCGFIFGSIIYGLATIHNITILI